MEGSARLTTVLYADKDLPPGEYDRRRAASKAKEELALREVAEGFPGLFGQGVVSLWGLLESGVRSVAASYIQGMTGALQLPDLAKLKVKLGEYEALDGEDRAYYVLDLVERELAGPLRSGAERFECLLKVFSLDGPVPDELGRTLFEFSQVRNLLAHKDGVADRRFVNNCPWLPVSVGCEFHVDASRFHKYASASGDYMALIAERIFAKA